MNSYLNKFLLATTLSAVLVTGSTAFADDISMGVEVRHIRGEWERIKYQVKDSSERLKEIEALKEQADALVDRYPGRLEPLLWDGIVTSEEAAMASVFRQLGLAKNARALFERALALDPNGLNGAVTMSLGVLYYRVPGFPIAFGDEDVARKDLETALTMDPDGLDANYFYGDFLITQKEYGKAKTVLTHALEAPVDTERPFWDAGRRAEVRALIAGLDRDLQHISKN